ncbi:MAG: LysM peptidoglycan-binding domain-containing protein, partial [Anaerolineae bacterium]|nr:LysM peptidoglycan-binding domain-containing protein [Anaerolineae bacterium]
MLYRMFSATFALLVKLILLALVSALLLYRTDFINAQTGGTDESPVRLPRNPEIEDDDEDDAEGDGDDPPTDNDGYDTPPGEEDNVVVYTIRPGDTLMKIAARLGVPFALLKSQDDTPSMIHPGQKFVYRPEDRIDSSIPLTDDDGTDSDGYDTPPPTTDFDGISTPAPTDNDGTDSDGYDTNGDNPDNEGIDTPS